MNIHRVLWLLVFFASAASAAPVQAPISGITIGNLYSAANGTGQQSVDSGIAAASVSTIGLTSHPDSDYSILSTDRIVQLSAALTAPRNWTLPCANSVPAGQTVQIIDPERYLSTKFLTIVPSCSNTLNGPGVNIAQLTSPGSRALAVSDGISNWSVTVVRQPERTLDFAGDFGGIPATAIGTGDCKISIDSGSGETDVDCPNTSITQADVGDTFEAQAIGPSGSTFIWPSIDVLTTTDPGHSFKLHTSPTTAPAIANNGKLRAIDAVIACNSPTTGCTSNSGYAFFSTQTLPTTGNSGDIAAKASPALMTVVAVQVNTGAAVQMEQSILH